MTLTARELMETHVISVSPETSLLEESKIP